MPEGSLCSCGPSFINSLDYKKKTAVKCCPFFCSVLSGGTLQCSLYLHNGVCLHHVADLDVVVSGYVETAVHSCHYLLDIVLESLQ